MNKIEKVKSFLDEFIDSEYEMEIACFEHDYNGIYEKAYEFFDKYLLFSAKRSFSELTVSKIDEDETEKKDYIDNILRKRRVFVIEEYEGCKLDSAIEMKKPQGNIFFCYVSHKAKISNNYYFKRFIICEMDGSLKIIATEINNPNEGWKEINQFQSVTQKGTMINFNKYEAPDKKDLDHYNSLSIAPY